MSNIPYNFIIEHPLLGWRQCIFSDTLEIREDIDLLFHMFQRTISNELGGSRVSILQTGKGKYKIFYGTQVSPAYSSISNVNGIVAKACFIPQVISSDKWCIFHAGAVSYGGKVVLLIGPTGAGKSTLIANLCLCGFTYLSDDIVPVDVNNLNVTSFPKPIFLRDLRLAKTKEVLASTQVKFYPNKISFENEVRHVAMPKMFMPVFLKSQITSIIVLNRKQTGQAQVAQLSIPQAHMSIIKNSHYPLDFNLTSRLALRLASTKPIFELTYAESNDCISVIKLLTDSIN